MFLTFSFLNSFVFSMEFSHEQPQSTFLESVKNFFCISSSEKEDQKRKNMQQIIAKKIKENNFYIEIGDFSISNNIIVNCLENLNINELDDIKNFFILIKDICNKMIVDYYYLTNNDKYYIINNLLIKVKEKENMDSLYETLTMDYCKNEYNKIMQENQTERCKKKCDEKEEEFLKLIYKPNHLFMEAGKKTRTETNENYQIILKYFFKKINDLHLILNPEMKASLTLLDKKNDEELRGFYCDIFESNLTDEEIYLVFEAFNNTFGCPDAARIHYADFQTLIKNNNFIERKSLQALKHKIHDHLQNERFKIFEEMISKTDLYQFKNTNDFEQAEYGVAYIRNIIAEIFGFQKRKIDFVYNDCAEEGIEFLKYSKRFFLISLAEKYSKDFIIQECLKLSKDYEGEILRYLQIKYFLKGEPEKIIPKMDLVSVENTKSTDYVEVNKDGNYIMNPKALLEVMEDLFGFSDLNILKKFKQDFEINSPFQDDVMPPIERYRRH